MAITNAAISGLAIAENVKQLLIKLNNSTAATLDIQAANISLEDKAAMRDVLAATATRAGLNARVLSLPVKYALLNIAGV